MRNHSRQNLRTFHRQSGIPRALTGEKPFGLTLKQSEIKVGKYKYDPKDELGRGFSANVYKGVEIVKQHKRYAIKVVNLKKFKGHSLDMLESQIEIHKNLTHQNIVKLHEVIKTAQHYYLVMQYCPHGNLSEYIAQKKQLSQNNTIEIMNQIISAYKYLIKQGVIHRDIKPANILRVGNKWKISDFGFAAKARFGFKDRVNVGTPLYMAPESLRRNYYSFKSDLYAIGIVMFEMLMGHTPYQAHSQKELLEKICNQVQVPQRVKNAQIIFLFDKLTCISDAKRLNKEELVNFTLDFHEEVHSPSSRASNNNSMMSMKDMVKGGSSTDQSSLNKFHNSSTNLSSKMPSREGSKVHWLQGSRNSSKQLQVEQPQQKQKNPMLINHEIISTEFQFVHHYYHLIQNIQSLHCQDSNKDMLLLVLFKLLLKLMRLLCDKNKNYFNLNQWQEYQQCKLYQQIYQDFTVSSQKYQKEYLEFVKHNDIKVIRAVNRKFPELCSNNPLTSRFYEHFKELVASVIRQHDVQLTALVGQGQTQLNDRFQALKSIFTTYKITDMRANSPFSTLVGHKPSLLPDYTHSKLTKGDFNSLKRSIKDI